MFEDTKKAAVAETVKLEKSAIDWVIAHKWWLGIVGVLTVLATVGWIV